jgi:hypothetical protein
LVDLAKGITPEQIDKGTALLQSGTGLYTEAQRALQLNSTNPALLPKTLEMKQAEYALGLPQYQVAPPSIISGVSNTVIYIGLGLLVLVVIFIALKKR